MKNMLDDAGVEAFYEALAGAIDVAGPERETLFLTRLALLLAHAGGDRGSALAAVSSALAGLDVVPLPGHSTS